MNSIIKSINLSITIVLNPLLKGIFRIYLQSLLLKPPDLEF